jgi:hypothetical protein
VSRVENGYETGGWLVGSRKDGVLAEDYEIPGNVPEYETRLGGGWSGFKERKIQRHP